MVGCGSGGTFLNARGEGQQPGKTGPISERRESDEPNLRRSRETLEA